MFYFILCIVMSFFCKPYCVKYFFPWRSLAWYYYIIVCRCKYFNLKAYDTSVFCSWCYRKILTLFFFRINLLVCHAELNAVLNKNSADVKNCTIYVALFPCNECAKVVIQSGIKEVVYYSDKYKDKPEFVASKKMLDMAGVKYRLVVNN